MSARFGFYILGFGAVVLLDWMTPLSVADWLIPMYLGCLASTRGNNREAIAVAAAASACVAAGLWSSPSGGMPFWMGALNRLAAIGIIWTSIYLARRRRMAESEARVLRGLLPICASCKRIRHDDEKWEALETYITRHSEARFTHTLCPACYDKYSEKGAV
jgi:hypothetical protein